MSNLPAITGGFSLAPTNLNEAMSLAKMIAESDLAPKDYKGKPANVLIAVQMGLEVGLQPMQAIQNIAVINGRPSMWGDAIVALVRSHPHFEYLNEEWDESTKTAICAIKRKGESEQVRTFGYEDAKHANLLNKDGPWKSYPKRMCQMRARAFACRDVFADALKGIHVAEEVQDIAAHESQQVDVIQGESKLSRTSSVSKKLADKTKKKSDITLQQVIDAFDKAQNPQDLTGAVELAAKLTHPEDKKAAGEAYKFRLQELKQAAKQLESRPAETIDQETGEILPETGYDPTDAPF